MCGRCTQQPQPLGVVAGPESSPAEALVGKCRTLVGMVTAKSGLGSSLSPVYGSPTPQLPSSLRPGRMQPGLRGCKGLRGARPGWECGRECGRAGRACLPRAEQPGWCGAKSFGEGAAF